MTGPPCLMLTSPPKRLPLLHERGFFDSCRFDPPPSFLPSLFHAVPNCWRPRGGRCSSGENSSGPHFPQGSRTSPRPFFPKLNLSFLLNHVDDAPHAPTLRLRSGTGHYGTFFPPLVGPFALFFILRTPVHGRPPSSYKIGLFRPADPHLKMHSSFSQSSSLPLRPSSWSYDKPRSG